MRRFSAILDRFDKTSDKQTLGKFDLYDENDHAFSSVTLELPWLDNARFISCIPKGKYIVKPYTSKKYPNVYEITGVPNRDKILMHWGNYYSNYKGCVGHGRKHKDLDKDGLKDITSTKTTIKELHQIVGDNEFELEIV